MTRNDLIFLIGYRGTGKSTVARLLAERLGWRALDADVVLEERHGRSIRQMFAEEGEAGFRDKESALLDELCRERYCVIATGGGVILRPENRARLQTGRVVCLQADANTIWQRLQRDSVTLEQRPTLTVGGQAEIEDLLGKREPWYRECGQVIVDTSARTPSEVVDVILKNLADS